MRSMMSQVGLRPIDVAYFDVTAIADPEQQMIRRLPVRQPKNRRGLPPNINTFFAGHPGRGRPCVSRDRKPPLIVVSVRVDIAVTCGSILRFLPIR